MSVRKMPKQRPATSEQTVGTPQEFLDAAEDRFGRIVYDLAATEANRVTPSYVGPGSRHGADSLAVDWATLPGAVDGQLFLNPPFGDIAPFAKKCAEQAPAISGSILLLVPASVGSNWFAKYVHGQALVLALRPRLTFVGHDHSYPKDLILAVYGRWVEPTFALWDWREEGAF